MFKLKNPSATTLRESIQAKDAVFMGWQKMKSGEFFALYNVIAAGHPSFGSTVTHDGLRKLNLQIPWTPLPEGLLKKF
jgi:hypothetical protein